MQKPDRYLKGLLAALIGFGLALAGVPLLYVLLHRNYQSGPVRLERREP